MSSLSSSTQLLIVSPNTPSSFQSHNLWLAFLHYLLHRQNSRVSQTLHKLHKWDAQLDFLEDSTIIFDVIV